MLRPMLPWTAGLNPCRYDSYPSYMQRNESASFQVPSSLTPLSPCPVHTYPCRCATCHKPSLSLVLGIELVATEAREFSRRKFL